MDSFKMLCIPKEKALEMIENDKCNKCGEENQIEYIEGKTDEGYKYLIRKCKVCGDAIRFSI